jgi:hypothetical protein
MSEPAGSRAGRTTGDRSTLVALSMKLNPLVATVLRSPLHWIVSSGLMLITVTGRRTGRHYTIPVGYIEADDAIVIMVADASRKVWWRNYHAAGPIELLLRRTTLHGEALVLPHGSAEFRQRAEACFRRSRLIGRIFGIAYDDRTGLIDAQLARLRDYAAIVRVTVRR